MIHEQHMKLRRLICDAFNPGTACDCWKGEGCPKAYPRSAQKQLEDRIVELFNTPMQMIPTCVACGQPAVGKCTSTSVHHRVA